MNNPASYKIRSIGGSLMVTLPQHIARAMELGAGDEVVIEHETMGYKRGVITIKPMPQRTPKNGKRK